VGIDGEEGVMTIIKKKMALYIMLVLLLCTLILAIKAAHQEAQLIAGIQVNVKSERRSLGTWFVEVRLARQFYSKDNLERIWRYYCEKYPDKKDKLDMRIYVDSLDFQSSSLKKSSFEDTYAAIFSRQGEGAIAGGGDNEFYTYRPNLDKPDKMENVQLKGKYPFLRNAYTGDPDSDFVVAAGKGDMARLVAFLERGGDPNTRDDRGRSALMAACRNGQTEVVKFLLANGAQVNARNNKGETALLDAVMAVRTDTKEKNGWRWGHPEIVKILLDNGADVNAQKEGWTPLLCAASHGNNDIVRLMLKANADVNAKTNTGMSALARALYDGKTKTAEILLEAGADVNTKDNEGNTPLMRAAVGYVKILRLLLEHGAHVNAANIHGETALKIAMNYPNNYRIIQMLLNAGARN
jgi:ankyrin repeat protein